MKPTVSELYEKYNDRVLFVAFNIDLEETQPYAMQFGVRGVPTFVFLTNAGTLIDQYAGERPKETLVESIDKLIEQDAAEKAAQ